MDLKPQIWGPHYWFFLHTLAFNYPLFPNSVTKKKYYEFIMNFPLFIPHTKSSDDFCALLDKYPVTPYLDSRKSFIKWVHFIHNRINEKLQLPQVDLEKFKTEYFHLYREKTSKSKKTNFIDDLRNFLKAYMFYLLFLLLCSCIYYLKYKQSN